MRVDRQFAAEDPFSGTVRTGKICYLPHILFPTRGAYDSPTRVPYVWEKPFSCGAEVDSGLLFGHGAVTCIMYTQPFAKTGFPD